MTYLKSLLAIRIAAVCLLTFSCGKKDGDSGIVKLEFAKKSGASLTGATEGFVAGSSLTTLKAKPIAVAISEANDSGYMVWGSKNCHGEAQKVDRDKKEYPYYVPNVCSANDGDDYLNMLDPTEFNAALNSQTWPVPPGTYKYVKLIFCSDSKADTVKNLAYRAPSMTADHEVTFCDPFIGYNETGVTIEEGGAITIKLTYDLDALVDSLTQSSDMPRHDIGAWTNNCFWVDDSTNGTQVQYCPKFGQGSLVPSIK